MLVSIILPTYNSESFLERTLNSLLEQSYQNFEILARDDGSSDGTRQLLDSFALKNNRLSVYHNESNLGPWETRRLLLEQAKGEYIAFLDSDDWWHPERLTRLLGYVQSRSQRLILDDLQCVDCDGSRLHTALEFRGFKEGPILQELTATEFVKYDLGVFKPIIHQSLVQDGFFRFDGRKRSGDDFRAMLDCLLLAGPGLLCREPLYFYRFQPNSVTSNKARLFRGTEAATADSLSLALSLGEDEVVALLQRRLRDIWGKKLFHEAKSAKSQGRTWTAMMTFLRLETLTFVINRFRQTWRSRLRQILKSQRGTGE